MLYDTIYDFFYGLFNTNYLSGYSSSIMGVDTSLASWLSHTFTIALMVLGVIVLLLFVRWIFRVFAGLIRW